MIKLSHLTVKLADGREVLSNLSFELEDGESLALLGGNGAGKSTLLGALLGLFPVYKGGAEIFSLSLEKKNYVKIRELAGFVFQNPDDQIFNSSVLEGIAFAPRNRGLDDESATRIAGETAETLGIGHLLSRAPQNLSYGEKKLVPVAGILAVKPKLFLLDEPDSSLDPKAKRELAEILNSLECSKIIATHDLQFAA